MCCVLPPTRLSTSLVGGVACIRSVSSSMPRIVRVVDGPRAFSGLTGAPTARQRRSMSRRALRQAGDEAGTAKKKSSR